MKNRRNIEGLVWACVFAALALAVFAVVNMSEFIHERNDATTKLNGILDTLAKIEKIDKAITILNTTIDSSAENTWKTEKVDEAKEAADKIKKTPVPYLARVVSGLSGMLLSILFLYLLQANLLTQEGATTDYSLFFFALAFSSWALPMPKIGIDYASLLNTAFLIPAFWGLDIKTRLVKPFKEKVTLFHLIVISICYFTLHLLLHYVNLPDTAKIIDNITSIILFALFALSFFESIYTRFKPYPGKNERVTGLMLGALVAFPCLIYLTYYYFSLIFGDADQVTKQLLLIGQFSFILSVTFMAFSWAYERERIANRLLAIQKVQIRHFSRNMLNRLVSYLEDKYESHALSVENAIYAAKDLKAHYELSEVAGDRVKIHLVERIPQLLKTAESFYGSFAKKVTLSENAYNSEICMLFISILNELMENAQKHGGGVRYVAITETTDNMVIEVENLTQSWLIDKNDSMKSGTIPTKHQGLYFVHWYARVIDSSFSLDHNDKSIILTFSKKRFI